MRRGIGLRGYAQQDPLNEFQQGGVPALRGAARLHPPPGREHDLPGHVQRPAAAAVGGVFAMPGPGQGWIATAQPPTRWLRRCPPARSRTQHRRRKAAVTTGANATGDIWVFDLRGAAQPRKMTFEGDDASPLWSKDGSRLFFYSIREGTRGIYELPADGSRGEPQRIGSGMPLDVSPDGAVLLTSRVGAATRGDISTLSLRGDNTEKPWLATPFDEGEAKFSPDGEWVAYTSDETGAVEVWVRPFSGAGAPVRVSPQGGRQPRWSADGKELFFEREDGGPTLLAVPVLEARSQIPSRPSLGRRRRRLHGLSPLV